MKSILIVGAGVAGLTAGYKFAESGYEVTIIEKEKSVGGLARSFQYGDFIFDIGPHRFHTDDPVVLDFIKKILADNILTIPRESGVWMFGKWHDWPLRPLDMFRFPPKVMLNTFLDLFRKEGGAEEDFKTYVLSRYGGTLYSVFFEPYTEKFLHLHPRDLHRDWAISGIDRAVIDKKVSINSAFDLLKTTLLPKPVKTQFLYPSRGGIQVFSEMLAGFIRKKGGRVLTGTVPRKITLDTGDQVKEVEFREEKMKPDHLIWTAPIPVLTRMLEMPDPGLRYLALILYNIELIGPPLHKYQWCYFGGYDTLFNRTSIPKLFSNAVAPPGMHGLCVEVSCLEKHPLWKHPEALRENIRFQLRVGGLCSDLDAIRNIHVERIPNTYPIYEMGFHQKLERINKELRNIPNLSMLGRTGTFWYNNMDHSIRMALDLSEKLITGSTSKTTHSRKL